MNLNGLLNPDRTDFGRNINDLLDAPAQQPPQQPTASETGQKAVQREQPPVYASGSKAAANYPAIAAARQRAGQRGESSATASNAATIPPQYQSLDEWKEAVKNLIQAKRDQHRGAYTNKEKLAIADHYDYLSSNEKMSKKQFCIQIMGYAKTKTGGGHTGLDNILADARRLRLR